MKRTLLAAGIAVLASMLFAPHRYYWEALGQIFYVQISEQEKGGPVFEYDPSNRTYRRIHDNERNSYVPDWCERWRWFPVFWIKNGNPVLWGNFVGQTAFVAVLAAVLANLRKSRQRTPLRD